MTVGRTKKLKRSSTTNEALYTPENLERARAEAETAEKCAALFGRRLEKANIAADSMRLRLARSGE